MSQKSSEDIEEEHGNNKHEDHFTQTSKEIAEDPHAAAEYDQDGEVYVGNNNLFGAELEAVASSKPSVNNIKSVPNGGLTAWLQVMSSFFLFFNTWGTVNTFVSISYFL